MATITNLTKETKRKGLVSSNTATNKDLMVSKYIKSISIMSKSTAHEYRKRLTNFREFIANEYATPTDDIVTKIRDGILDVYDVLNGYSAYLQRNHSITMLTLKQRIVTVKNFLEYNDVDISPRKFKLKVKLPRAVRKNKEALSKQDIGDILNA